KRASSAELNILEGIFKRDNKPNAALRNEIARQLNLTPRKIQIWFQSRRAHEKGKVSKETGTESSGKE
ncbi:hypothetical protein B0H19DRAFT_957626, partial [Mycena capillaripes]